MWTQEVVKRGESREESEKRRNRGGGGARYTERRLREEKDRRDEGNTRVKKWRRMRRKGERKGRRLFNRSAPNDR